MNELTYVCPTEEDTKALGFKLGEILEKGSIITLSGELGAGKTTFTQGLAKGLGVEKNITSPTFTLMKNYQGRLSLNHIDAYRLENIEQDLGFEEFLNSDGVTVVEWAIFIPYMLPEELLNVEITINDDFSRTIKFTAFGSAYQEVLDKLCTL